jgi:hypothetical protein
LKPIKRFDAVFLLLGVRFKCAFSTVQVNKLKEIRPEGFWGELANSRKPSGRFRLLWLYWAAHMKNILAIRGGHSQ